MQEAFHTSIHKYLVKGEQHWANASDPQIPTALTSAVAGVASMNNFPRKAMNAPSGTFTRDKSTGKIQPEYTFPGGCVENNSVDNSCAYGLGPYDFATIYDVLPLWNAGINGTGQTIAIVGETNINLQDVADFRTMFGLPGEQSEHHSEWPGSGDSGRRIRSRHRCAMVGRGRAECDHRFRGFAIDGDDCRNRSVRGLYRRKQSGSGDERELRQLRTGAGHERQSVLQRACGSRPRRKESRSSFRRETMALRAATISRALPAPAQFGLQVSGYASTPYNVAVGGTDFNDFSNPGTYWNTTNNSTTQASAKSYIPETTWNDSCTNASSARWDRARTRKPTATTRG